MRLILLCIITFVLSNDNTQASRIIKIGALLLEEQRDSSIELAFKFAVYKINKENQILPNSKIIYDIQYVKNSHDSFHANKRVCSQVQQGVQAIFSADRLLSNHVRSICENLDIPHLDITNHEDPKTKDFSINLYPDQNLLNRAFQDTIKFLNWTKVAIIYEQNYGFMKLRDLMKFPGLEIIVRQSDPSSYNSVLQELKNKEIHNLIIDTNPNHMNEFLKQILLLEMNQYKFHYFFTTLDLEYYDMEDFKLNFVNITSFRMIDFHDVAVKEVLKEMEQHYLDQNVKAFKKSRVIETNAALMYDAVFVFAAAISSMNNLKDSNVSCDNEIPWKSGLTLYNYLDSIEFKGISGPIEFKEGRRQLFKLDLVKLKQHSVVKVGEWLSLREGTGLNITDYAVFFDQNNPPNVTLVVITILELPYVQMHVGKNYTGNERFYGFCVDILERLSLKIGFNYIIDLVPDGKYGAFNPLSNSWNGIVGQIMKHEKPYIMMRGSKMSNKLPLKYKPSTYRVKPYGRLLKIPYNRQSQRTYNNYYNNTEEYMSHLSNEDNNDNYEGFCIDLLKILSQQVDGFEYRISLVADGKYGIFDGNSWNGIVKSLMEKKADLAVGSMTINYARESVIDFTKPFMNLGISILFKVPKSQETKLFSFLNPLKTEIWLYILIAYCLVSLTIYVVARFSPYESECEVHAQMCSLENGAIENHFTLSNSFWFMIGTLMQQGSDLNPKATSTRIVGGVWWFFTLIIISSYTANLAAFLTVERMITPIENADDLAAQTEISYGTLESGSTMTFFRDSMIETYKKMWRFMENRKPSVFVSSYEEGIKRVLEHPYAFLMESTMLDYTVQRDCNLTQIGGLLDSKGYGIATPKGSLWRDRISLAILDLQERGEIQMLYDKWWKNTGNICPRDEKNKESKANALGVENIGGVFVVLLCGLAFAVLIAIVEFCYKSKKENFTDPLNLLTKNHSFCSEMTEEFCFAMSCRGSRQRSALKRNCSECVANRMMDQKSVTSSSNIYSHVIGGDILDENFDYCNKLPPDGTSSSPQRKQSYFDFENNLKCRSTGIEKMSQN